MKKLTKKLFLGFFIFALFFSNVGQILAVTIDSIDLVSKHTNGTIGDGYSSAPKVSEDGRYVFFLSGATNLVANDTNGFVDLFMRDTQTNTTTRISVSTAGVEANATINDLFISNDGRYVFFSSEATNLVANDTNGVGDVFMRDTQTNTTTRISVSTAGVAGDGASDGVSSSSSGRYVVFASNSTNLVTGDNNSKADIFVRDTQLNTTTRISVSTAGAEGDNHSTGYSMVSNDGRYAMFRSYATNLVANDTNAKQDVFVRDTQLNTTTRVSVSTAGAEGDDDSILNSITRDGRYIIFESYSTNLVANDTNVVRDVFVRDTQLNTTTRVSVSTAGVEGDGESAEPTVSEDGRYVVFRSDATNLISGDTNSNSDVFISDTVSGTTELLSKTILGVIGNNYSGEPYITQDASYLVFSSDATNLASGDTNGVTDIFLLSLSYISTPTTTTQSASNITTTTATLNGNITSTGGEANTERGFDIGTDNTYTMTDVADPTGSYSTGAYTGSATGLTCGTTYHYRAYSTNTAGTGTGSDETFTTSACPVATSSGGSVPVWILQSMSDAMRNTQNTNQPQNNTSSNTNQTPTTPIPQTPTPQPKFQFTKNLKYRDRNNDVLELQKFLNNNGYTVSNVGAGSMGFETTYFGTYTRNALIKFQKDNNIKPAVGYFGILTRRVVNAMTSN